MNRRPALQLIAPGASPVEAAAIAAALQRFMADHASASAVEVERRSAWFRAGLLEGVGREAEGLGEWASG